jgi:hypothetical protein
VCEKTRERVCNVCSAARGLTRSLYCECRRSWADWSRRCAGKHPQRKLRNHSLEVQVHARRLIRTREECKSMKFHCCWRACNIVVQLVLDIAGVRRFSSQLMEYSSNDGEMNMSVSGSWIRSGLAHHHGFVRSSETMLGKNGLD